MSFMDSYKHLEKLCGEVLNDDRRISAYIDEMLNKPRGSYLIRGWDNDLKQLKHYRWVRNQIVHELGCSEENMCDASDALWLDHFYSRIMNQNDPLALYYQATKPQTVQQSHKVQQLQQPYSTHNQPNANHEKNSCKSTDCIIFIVCSFLIVMAILLLFKIL